MQTTSPHRNDSRETARIRAVLDEWREAARARDVARVMACYADDLVAFDALGPLCFRGKADYAAHWERCMSYCQGEMVFNFDELAIEQEGGLAFARFLNRCGMIDEAGKEQCSWMRATVCLRLLGGQWRIVHEHHSVPFEPENGKALFDLQP